MADFIKFLGTAGARFVMIKQLRQSGGLWISCAGTQVLVDPGPGSLVRCIKSRPKLNPEALDGVILTHRHIDHANDVNVIIEAMTEGGFKKRGVVCAPQDALDGDPVIFQYLRPFPEKIEILKPRGQFRIGAFVFETSMPHIHPAQTYGLKFTLGNRTVGLMTDTRFFPELTSFYRTDILIINVILLHPRPGVDHLSVEEVKILLGELRPRQTILTHFGMTMLKAKPELLAQQLAQELNLDVVAARDGMTVSF